MNSREAAQKEWEEVLEECIAEEEKITNRLKAEGKWTGGLDGNNEEYKAVSERRKTRMREIQEKYQD
nr:MAG TPA: hypothetical protein [Caudoviricetes sp.]